MHRPWFGVTREFQVLGFNFQCFLAQCCFMPLHAPVPFYDLKETSTFPSAKFDTNGMEICGAFANVGSVIVNTCKWPPRSMSRSWRPKASPTTPLLIHAFHIPWLVRVFGVICTLFGNSCFGLAHSHSHQESGGIPLKTHDSWHCSVVHQCSMGSGILRALCGLCSRISPHSGVY